MATNQKPPKKSKEEREQEYLDAVSRVFTHPLMDWQKELLLTIRRATIEGRPIEIEIPKAGRIGR